MDAELIQSIVAATASAGLTAGAVLGGQKWQRRNGGAPQTKDVCEERHKGLERRLESMDKKLDRLLEE